MLDHAVDQLFTERVMLARLLAVLEEDPQIIREVFRRVNAPRVQILQGGNASITPLDKLGFAHRENFLFSAAISSAAAANSAPRLIRPHAARFGLSHRIHDDHAIDNRHRRLERDALQRMRHTFAHHLMMVGVARDQNAKADDAIALSAGRQRQRRPRHFMRTRYAHDRDVRVFHLCCTQSGMHAGEQSIDQRLVETRRCDANAERGTVDDTRLMATPDSWRVYSQG